jgi:hypothetical protein
VKYIKAPPRSMFMLSKNRDRLNRFVSMANRDTLLGGAIIEDYGE